MNATTEEMIERLRADLADDTPTAEETIAALTAAALAEEEPPTAETPVAPPPLWWLRDGIADAQLHRVDPQREGKTRCKLTLHEGRFRPASAAEVRTRRRCPVCRVHESPPKAEFETNSSRQART